MEQDQDETLAELRAVREALRAGEVTQTELGERAGVSQRAVGHIENGTASPRVDTLVAVHQALLAIRAERAAKREPGEPGEER